MEIEDFKKEYESQMKKFALPAFKKLEEDFEIRKVEGDDFVLRAARKIMMDRIINSLGFLEMLLTPMNAPRMYHSFLTSLTVEVTKKIEEVYARLATLSILSLEREIEYSEKAEAATILEIVKVWDDVKPVFKDILEKMKKPKISSEKRERSYFG